ncbi:MAG TPA: Trk system potassium transporter TrkA [Alphaproteobacteria bacterium]|nr:Trk system potassium transporter TrkA [Alphaproteobacteria bacterium]
MKIIVGGAGSVGRSIISYLTRADNDIVVLDTNQEKLDEIAKEFDVQPVLGSISRPDILEKVGADTADILIAATDNDEVNLVACQVAYTLFNVPKKIARVTQEYFLSPLWNTLYNEKSLPVDLVISPDQEIAERVLQLLSVPGAKEVYSFADDNVQLVCLKCFDECSLYQFKISELYENFKELNFSVVQILRDGVNFFPKPDESIKQGDEVYVLALKEDIPQVLHAFNVGQKSTENVVIFGGNAISYDIARHLEENDNIASIKVITNNINAAHKMSEHLNKSVIIYGEMMSDVILNDANLEKTDTTISVTSLDKDNLLLSLLAQYNGVTSTMSLVNSRVYDNLTNHISGNIIIDRSTITISKILQDIRHVKLLNAYSLGRGFAEVWELKLKNDSMLEDKKLEQLILPDKCKIIGIERDKKLLFPEPDMPLELDDVLIMIVAPNCIQKVETIFSI